MACSFWARLEGVGGGRYSATQEWNVVEQRLAATGTPDEKKRKRDDEVEAMAVAAKAELTPTKTLSAHVFDAAEADSDSTASP